MSKMNGGTDGGDKPVIECAIINTILIPYGGEGEFVTLQDYIAIILSENPDVFAAVKDIVTACIEAGLRPEGLILEAVKACIAEVGTGGTVTVVPKDGAPGVSVVTITLPGQPPKTFEVCCPDPTVSTTSATTTAADSQAAADAAATGKAPSTLIKVEESDGCVATYIVDTGGNACLLDRPHRHKYAEVRVTQAGIIMDENTPEFQAGNFADDVLCLPFTLPCKQDVRVNGFYHIRNLTGPQLGNSQGITVASVFTIDGASVGYDGESSAAYGLDVFEENQTPETFIIPNVSAGTHTLCISFASTVNTIPAGHQMEINQIKFTVGSWHE